MDRGYFPVFRRIFNSDLWENQNATRLFIYILGHITHVPTTTCSRYKCIPLNPGQMVSGRQRLALECGFTERTVRTALAYLKTTNRVTIEATKRFSIITVVNWQRYRDWMLEKGQQNGQQNDHETTMRRPSGDHIKEVKKLRMKERSSVAAPSPSGIDPGTGRDDETPSEKYEKAKAAAKNKCCVIGCGNRYSSRIGNNQYCSHHLGTAILH